MNVGGMSVDQHARNIVYVLNATGIHYKLLNRITHETIVELTTNQSANFYNSYNYNRRYAIHVRNPSS